MATIENLKPSILLLSRSEQLALVLDRRTDRRITKYKLKKTKAPTAKKRTKVIVASASELVTMLTAEQRLIIIQQLTR